jgi:hypothetical protein
MVRFPQYRSVLLVVQRPSGSADWLTKAGAALVDLLRPALGTTASVASRWVEAAGVGVMVVHDGARDEPLDLPTTFAWGCPVVAGGGGELSEAAMSDRLREPSGLHTTNGRWVLCEIGTETVRLVTSADTVHTLRSASGPIGTTWGTHSVPTAWLSGARLSVRTDVIGELLFFDYALGSNDLLTGVDVLDDAAVVDIRSSGPTYGSWWPVADRLAPGPPTTSARLREVVRDASLTWASAPNGILGLTAGRDSTLIASCLQESGTRMATFTLGPTGYIDVDQAAVTARRVGLHHRPVESGPPAERHEVVARALITGAAETARNLTGGPWLWDAIDAVWVSGHGGEIGRAFYWAGNPDADAARANLIGRIEAILPAAHAAAAVGHVDAELRAAEQLGRPGLDALDVFYLRNRMRRWLGNSVPRRQIADGGFVYLGPHVVAALLDLPVDDRISGRSFDAALALGPEMLRPDAAIPRPRAPKMTRLIRKVRGPTVAAPTAAGALQVDLLLALFPGELRVREMLGADWWDGIVSRSRAGGDPGARRVLFNALSVEALIEALGGVAAAPAD